MTDKVGTKTGKQTQAGRDVYVTPEGENVSEKSTTFKYKGKWINVPSIHDGRKYDDDTLKLMLDAEIIEPTSSHKNREDAEKAAKARSDNLKFNKGGTPMKDQMELFEDGGLKDEGGMVDKESGNEVPVGGTRKGVRDDIPAMVSEGEFVFPEDVVRYIGLDKLMQLRQKAKVGLKRMEEMGQMGNSDEATVPDDMPMDSPDLVIVAGEAPKEMAEGGAVVGGVEQTAAPRRLTPEVQQPERKQVSFKQLMGKNAVEFKQYRNAQGASLLIPFVGGNPIYPIPSGYTLYDASTDTADPTSPEGQADAIATEVSTAINKATGNDRDDDGPAPVPQSAFQKAGSWDMDTSGKDGKALQMWIDEATKYTNGTSTVVTGVAAAFGLGPLVMYGVSRDKKEILKDIDAKIAQARKTDMAGQVAALEAIKKDLTEKNTGISSALSSLATTVSDLFNLSNEQKETAVTTASKVTELEDSIVEQAPAPVSEPTVTQEGGFGAPLVDELIPKPKPTATPATVSGPAAAEAQFGAPLGDPLGGTPPAVDELVFTPSLPVPPVSSYDEVKADPRLLESAGVPFQYPAPTPVTTPAPQPTTPVGASSFGDALTQQAPSLIAEDIQQTDAYKLRYGDTDDQMQSLMPPVVSPSAPVVTGYDDAPLFTTPSTPTPVKPSSKVSTDRGYVPTNVAKPAITDDPRGRDQIPTVRQDYADYREPTAKAAPAPAPSYATMDMGEAGRTSTPTASTKTSAPDTSIRPKSRPTTSTTTKTNDTNKDSNIASSGRTETQVQADINKALKDSGGEWTSELNDLVSERDSARTNDGGNDSDDSGGGSTSSYSCYVATALTEKGYWTTTKKIKLIKWCMQAKPENKLDTKLWRNGYVTFGKNVIAPHVDNKIIQWLSNGFYYATVYNKKSLQAIVGKLFYYIPSYTIGIYKALRGKLVDIKRT